MLNGILNMFSCLSRVKAEWEVNNLKGSNCSLFTGTGGEEEGRQVDQSVVDFEGMKQFF